MLSSVGDWVNYVAMVSLVYGQTHQALMLAALRLCHILPILLLAPFAGVFVDRWSRKWVLVGTPLVAAAGVGVLPLYHPVAMVFLAYAVITVALMFFQPALSAAMPNIVGAHELVAANTLSQITSTVSIVLGGVVGGVIVSQVGPQPAFAVDGLSFLVIGILALTVTVRDDRVRATVSTIEHELAQGIRYLRDERRVRMVVMAGVVFIFAPASVFTLGVVFVQSDLHAGSRVYGEIVGSMGAGSLVGAAWMIGRRPRLREDVLFAISGIVLGLAIAAMGLARSPSWAALAYAMAGLATVMNSVSAVTLIQKIVPDGLRGRIFAVSSTFDHAGAFGSTLLIGVGTGLLRAGSLISASGAIAALAGLGCLWQALRQPDRSES